MTKPKVKARSETTESIGSNTRPISRASTASAQTVLDQPNTHSRRASELEVMGSNYASTHQHSQYPADFLNHFQPHPNNEYAPHVAEGSYQANQQAHPSQYQPSAVQNLYQAQFAGREDTPLSNVNADEDREGSLAPEGQKKKTINTNVANEQELRRLFEANKTRTLKDVARSVLAEERGPRSEKTKQIFAMLW